MRMGFQGSLSLLAFTGILTLLIPGAAVASPTLPQPITISSGWQLQDIAKVSQSGAVIAVSKFKPQGWYAATVPGTVLTSLVNDGVYPEPLYGENNRPDKIPDSLCRTSYWYRTSFKVPKSYAHSHIWLNLDGINYSADIWVNGKLVGSVRGAFIRGTFDISENVKPGKKTVLAILVSPQPHPGVPHEHTIRDGLGKNGGITAIDGPTFLSTMGWDWIPAIRDRDTGIWQKVFISASGPAVLKNPLVTTDLPLPRLDTADITIQTTVENVTDFPQKGVLEGSFGDISFQQPVELAPHSSQIIALDPRTTPALHVHDPKLWWPNGYGPQNLYTLHLAFDVDGKVSDSQDVSFGVRKITYSVPDSPNLTISVNGVPVFIRGGDWGLDEAMKRIPRQRLEAEIRMHQIANLNMIRNWVGQSTSEDFYDLCDKYGLLVWDEFFQPSPNDGPDPTDFATYMANVRDKILRFRNHPSIAIWCARNEGHPPRKIDDALRALMAELEPNRLYQASSTDGRGVNSNGPYHWRTPREFYAYSEAFKTEVGSVSIPTIESIHGMMPEKDWETINDDWAEHDFAKGASGSDSYPGMIADRYGKIANLADFVRKSQLANYEAFRAMYEGRNAKLFHPTTGVITWMSNPAQPSFVWQLYHHDLEPNSALFAVKKAAEPVHIQLNESDGDIQVINNLATPLLNARAHITIYNLDGSVQYQHDFDVSAPASEATNLGRVEWPASLSAVHFVRLELRDTAGQLLSDNFYWHALPEHPDDLKALGTLPTVTLDAKITRNDTDGKSFLSVTLHNPGSQIALMAHLQLRRKVSGERVLPVYYSDNYVSLAPDESRTITIEAAASDLQGEVPIVVVDGWNIGVIPSSSSEAAIGVNTDAQVDHWPVTGLPIVQ
ncbi:MAG: sugar-binding domain-containing protein [Silvibacterium sp.]